MEVTEKGDSSPAVKPEETLEEVKDDEAAKPVAATKGLCCCADMSQAKKLKETPAFFAAACRECVVLCVGVLHVRRPLTPLPSPGQKCLQPQSLNLFLFTV